MKANAVYEQLLLTYLVYSISLSNPCAFCTCSHDNYQTLVLFAHAPMTNAVLIFILRAVNSIIVYQNNCS